MLKVAKGTTGDDGDKGDANDDAFEQASISGRTLTLTRGDGSSQAINIPSIDTSTLPLLARARMKDATANSALEWIDDDIEGVDLNQVCKILASI